MGAPETRYAKSGDVNIAYQVVGGGALDCPWAPTPEERQTFYEEIEEGWGGHVDLKTLAPSLEDDDALKGWLATYMRRSASPGAALALAKMNTEIDVRHVLPTIRVPTLCLHRSGDLDSKVEEARFIASEIPGARFVELPGADHLPWIGDQSSILDEVEEFLTGARHVHEPDRVLATVLFTDIVGSTERAQRIGDSAWRDLLEQHNVRVRKELERFRGRELDTAGDGFLASFDGPAGAVRCACAIRDGFRGSRGRLGHRVRGPGSARPEGHSGGVARVRRGGARTGAGQPLPLTQPALARGS